MLVGHSCSNAGRAAVSLLRLEHKAPHTHVKSVPPTQNINFSVNILAYSLKASCLILTQKATGGGGKKSLN